MDTSEPDLAARGRSIFDQLRADEEDRIEVRGLRPAMSTTPGEPAPEDPTGLTGVAATEATPDAGEGSERRVDPPASPAASNGGRTPTSAAAEGPGGPTRSGLAAGAADGTAGLGPDAGPGADGAREAHDPVSAQAPPPATGGDAPEAAESGAPQPDQAHRPATDAPAGPADRADATSEAHPAGVLSETWPPAEERPAQGGPPDGDVSAPSDGADRPASGPFHVEQAVLAPEGERLTSAPPDPVEHGSFHVEQAEPATGSEELTLAPDPNGSDEDVVSTAERRLDPTIEPAVVPPRADLAPEEASAPVDLRPESGPTLPGHHEPAPDPDVVPVRPARALPRVMAVANQKGGVGKTTTAVNLGAALAELGYRTLVVDLDPQGNATTGLGINARTLGASVYDVLMRDLPVEDAVEPTSVRNLFVVPATIDLAGAEIELVPAFSRELRLKRALEGVADDFDFTLIDCPPSLGLLTVNALAAATEVVVPVQCEYYALEGLSALLRNVQLVQTNLNTALEMSTIILTMYDARTKLAEQVANEVRLHFGSVVCRHMVPRTVRLSEAPSFGQPIIVFDPSSRGAIAYRELAKEVSGGTPQRVG